MLLHRVEGTLRASLEVQIAGSIIGLKVRGLGS